SPRRGPRYGDDVLGRRLLLERPALPRVEGTRAGSPSEIPAAPDVRAGHLAASPRLDARRRADLDVRAARTRLLRAPIERVGTRSSSASPNLRRRSAFRLARLPDRDGN